MRRHMGALVLVPAVLLGLAVVGATGADKGDVDKEAVESARKIVLKVTDLEAKGDTDAAKKEAAAQAKKIDDVKYAMTTLALRREYGLGMGPKAGAITPDGIEAKLISISKKPMAAKDLAAQADALAQAGNVMAAVADISLAKVPKKQGEKDPKKWTEYSNAMHAASLKLSAAAKAKDANGVLAAAKDLYGSCSDCHAIWKQ